MKYIIYPLIILVMTFTLTACDVGLGSVSSPSGTESELAEGNALPVYFKSLDDIKTVVQKNDFSGNANLRNLDYINVLSDSISGLNLSDITVTAGSVAVYYPISNSEGPLLDKYKEDKEITQLLSNIKVVTFRNVIIDDDVPNIVKDNKGLFSEHKIGDTSFYVSDIKDNGTLVGREIFWVQDRMLICVGTPGNISLEDALKYCRCSKHFFK